MAVGISNCLESLADLEGILVAAVDIVKGGVWKNIFVLVGLVQKVANLVKDLPKCLPELKDIDHAEAGQLVAKVYQLIEDLIQRIKK